MEWNNVLTTDCEIIRMDKHWIYPIFKNGWNGFMRSKKESRTNEQIKGTDLITVYMRDPIERFSSGVNKYAQMHKMDPHKVVDKIENERLTDRHWVPQWYWLLHLSKYYKKDVKLLPMSAIPHNRKKQTPNKISVKIIEKYTLVDQYIMDVFLNTTTNLKKIITESRHVLS